MERWEEIYQELRIAELEAEVLKARVRATNADRTAELAEKDKHIAALEAEVAALRWWIGSSDVDDPDLSGYYAEVDGG